MTPRQTLFDNPLNFRRESWVDGHLSESVCRVFLEKCRKAPLHSQPFTPDALVAWQAGKPHGDPLALPRFYREEVEAWWGLHERAKRKKSKK